MEWLKEVNINKIAMIFNDKLIKLLDNNSEKIDDWVEKINAYKRSYIEDNKYSKEEQVKFTYDASGALREITELFFKYGAFKDKFNNSRMLLFIDGPAIIIESEKTGNIFHLAIGNEGIYLDTNLRFAENLRFMNDSFYIDILSLDEFGDFELIQNECFGKETTQKYPGIFNNNKSKLFKILRNYFIGTVEQREYIFIDNLQIAWSPKIVFYDLVAYSCMAFRILYRLNYELWKISDLQKKK